MSHIWYKNSCEYRQEVCTYVCSCSFCLNSNITLIASIIISHCFVLLSLSLFSAPTPVPDLNLTPYTNSICVAWSVPIDNGGQDINRYLVQWASVTSDEDGSTPSSTTSDAVVGEFTNTTVVPPRTTQLIMSLASTTTYM